MLQFIWNLSCKTLIVVVILLIACNTSVAENRVALVIGNSNYQNTGSLKNPVNDANLMEQSLKRAGFEVTKILDTDYKSMKRAMLEFGRKLRDGPEAGLFYYAGHAIQVRGENYLLPVNIAIDNEDEIELEAINANFFLRIMNSSSSSINIVVLDACRNNPFTSSFRSVGRGLAPVDAPKGTYIAYSTSPGDVASDGSGNNSPYSQALAKAMDIPNIKIEQVFKQARKVVLKTTDGQQVPWETSSITGDFYFHPTAAFTDVPDLSLDESTRAYHLIKDSDNIELLEFFLNQYPESIAAKFVKKRIKALQKKKDLPKSRPDIDANSKSLNKQFDAVVRLHDDRFKNRNNNRRSSSDEFVVLRAESFVSENSSNFPIGAAELVAAAEAAMRLKKFSSAVRLYQVAAKKGHTGAMYSLAMHHKFGLGTNIDYGKSAKLFAKAVVKKHVGATYALGEFYHHGQGVSKDYAEAVRLYTIAASKEYPTAFYGLSELYERGQGVERDPEISADFMSKAIKAGHEYSLRKMTLESAKWSKEFRQALQRILKNEGHYNGGIDGTFGPTTLSAIERMAAG